MYNRSSQTLIFVPNAFQCQCLHRSQHITLDMLISTLETIWTFSIAYPTAVALGRILLQTAPERPPPGSGGPMEVFLRAMREVNTLPAAPHSCADSLSSLCTTGRICFFNETRSSDIPTSSTSRRPTSGNSHCLAGERWAQRHPHILQGKTWWLAKRSLSRLSSCMFAKAFRILRFCH